MMSDVKKNKNKNKNRRKGGLLKPLPLTAFVNDTALQNDATKVHTIDEHYDVYDNLPDVHPQTGEKMDKEAYYNSIVDNPPKTDGAKKSVEKKGEPTKTFIDIYTDNLANKRNIDTKELKGALDKFSKWISVVESSMNNKARPKIEGNTARGFFQFNDAGVETLKQRIKNVAERYKLHPPQYMNDFIEGKKDITDLNYDQQKELFVINFAEDRNSKVADILKEENFPNQYIFHHRDPNVIDHYIKTGEYNLDLAKDKNIPLNLLRVKKYGYENVKPRY